MTNHRSNCLICGEELIYSTETTKKQCGYCGGVFDSNAACKNDHYICDECHAKPAVDVIRSFCLTSDSINPIEAAQRLMKHPSVKMHGPEHHFLIPAVLLMCSANHSGDKTELPAKLTEAQNRAKNVLGGFCGFYGSCGAAVGTGIFMSLLTNASPLSKDTWQQTNLMTSEALYDIAINGGPRCCKRNTYLALSAAVRFLDKNLDISLEIPDNIACTYSVVNKECKGESCLYFCE